MTAETMGTPYSVCEPRGGGDSPGVRGILGDDQLGVSCLSNLTFTVLIHKDPRHVAAPEIGWTAMVAAPG